MSLLTLARWEWFKLRGRRVTWGLLTVLVLFSSFFVLVRFGDYHFQKDRDIVDELIFVPGAPVVGNFEVDVNCTEFLRGVRPSEVPAPYTLADIDVPRTEQQCLQEGSKREARLEGLIDEFTLPTSIAKALRWTELISIPFLAFFTVLVVGSEYGWGTLRTALMKGTGRWRLLAAKLGLIMAAMAVVWLVVLATIIVTSLVTTGLTADAGHGAWTAAAVGDVAADLGRAWFSGLPYLALAALFAIVFSRWAGGVLAAAGLAIGYFFFELFSVGRLIKLFDGVAAFRWFGSLAEFDLGWNTAAWMFGKAGEPIPGFALAGAIGVADYPGDVHAFVVQAVYTVVLLAIGFGLFQRRDVTGPSG